MPVRPTRAEALSAIIGFLGCNPESVRTGDDPGIEVRPPTPRRCEGIIRTGAAKYFCWRTALDVFTSPSCSSHPCSPWDT